MRFSHADTEAPLYYAGSCTAKNNTFLQTRSEDRGQKNVQRGLNPQTHNPLKVILCVTTGKVVTKQIETSLADQYCNRLS